MSVNPEASKTIPIGILTVSDRASQGAYEDISGKTIIRLLKKYIAVPWKPVYRVIADNRKEISRQLKKMADRQGCALIITTGGTGPAPRDVTPQATESVCKIMLPGFGERMRSVSLCHTPTAILSRQTAGIRNKTLILNLPGKPAAVTQCLRAVFPAVPHCLALIGGPHLKCRAAAFSLPRR